MHNIQSPRTDDNAIEQEIQAKGKTAPRVTPAAIEAVIIGEAYFTAESAVAGSGGFVRDAWEPLKYLTFGVLIMCIFAMASLGEEDLPQIEFPHHYQD